MTDMPAFIDYLKNLQQTICTALAQADGKADFLIDEWSRPAGGGGITRVLSDGQLFEQGGVNFSHVFGEGLPPSATAARPEMAGAAFEAAGVSMVLHPKNPFVPTTHMNVRCFVAKTPEQTFWWFGGGYDLTPYYGFVEDCTHWHRVAASACAPYGPTVYPRMKGACDRYFYLKHRKEARGIGGLFFDDWTEGGWDQSFSLTRSIGSSFLEAYLPIVQRRQDHAYTQAHRDFQLYRRGRYVEFNLVYDRGTLFGLQSDGRTESILMSLPPEVNWRYNWAPAPGTAEAQLTDYYLKPRDWLVTTKAEAPA